ncbi:MAG: hypothetical protein ACOYLQ_00330 [Hyphomicrobiaceae bacterium]
MPVKSAIIDVRNRSAAMPSDVRRGAVRLALLAGAATLAAYGALAIVPARYAAEARLALAAPGADARAHLTALESAELHGEVIRRLSAKDRAAIAESLIDATVGRLRHMVGLAPSEIVPAEKSLLDAFRSRLTLKSRDDGRSIAIRFTATSPAVAADVANALASAYRNRVARIALDAAGNPRALLAAQVEALRSELASSEAEIAHLRRLGATGGDAVPVFGGQAGQLAEAEAQLASAASIAGAARDAAIRGTTEGLPDGQQSKVVKELSSQQAALRKQIYEGAVVMKPNHPRMLQLNAELTRISRRLADEIEGIAQRLESDVAVAAARVATLKRENTGQQAPAGGEGALARLESIARAKRTDLQRLETRLATGAGLEPKPVIEIRAIEAARVPSGPLAPHKGFWPLIPGLLVLVLGGAVPALRHYGYLDWRRMRRQGAGTAAQMGVIGASPRPVARIADATSVILAQSRGRIGFRTIVAGSTLDVDAASEALSLARALSDAGQKVLLIDCTRSSEPQMLDRLLGPRPKKGLADVVADGHFEGAIVAVPGTVLHRLAWRGATSKSSFVPSGEELNLMLDALDEVYDQIVVTGTHASAAALFEAIEGRMDVAIEVGGKPVKSAAGYARFLNFDVVDMTVLTLAASKGAILAVRRLLQRPAEAA